MYIHVFAGQAFLKRKQKPPLKQFASFSIFLDTVDTCPSGKDFLVSAGVHV